MSAGRGSYPSYVPTAQWSSTALPQRGRVSTSRTEILQIVIAYVVLTFDLAIVLGGGGFLFGASGYFFVSLSVVVTAAAAALTGFVAHEMAHKIAAQRRGFWAEFRMAPVWLLISVFTAFLGFLFAAPGATLVGGMDDRKNWGWTGLAGPISNVGFSVAFLGGAFAVASRLPSVEVDLLFLAFINGWFAVFNLIPFGPLDGRKVLTWNVGIWFGAILVSAVLAGYSYLALGAGTPFLIH